MNFNDLTGQRFGRISVLYRSDDHLDPSGRHHVMWRCRCDCGTERDVNGDSLKRGHTVSCGCYNREQARENHLTHGHTDTHLYGVWCAIKRRCYNEKTHAYKDYGGRGIKMCETWKDDYPSFEKWALVSGYRDVPNLRCTIDRIDVNGDYEPSNCRWVDAKQQANNRRSNRNYTFNGETHNIMEWSKILGINYKSLHNRLYSHTFEEAIAM